MHHICTRRVRVFQATPASTAIDNMWLPLSLAPAAWWEVVGRAGGDIRVYAQDGVTRLSRSSVAFNYAAKTGSLFIARGAATSIFIEAGTDLPEPAAAATYGKYAAWSQTTAGVWHQEDMTDATVNQLNGTSGVPPTFAAGVLDNGGVFGGTKYISLGTSNPLPAGVGTIALWAKMANTTFANNYVIAKGNDSGVAYPGSWGLDILPVNTTHVEVVLLYKAQSPVGYVLNANYAAVPTAWHYYVATMTADPAQVVYVDAQVAATGTLAQITPTAANPTNIGCHATGYYAQASIDEVRLDTRPWSATEVAAHFANQSAPGTFWTIGHCF